MILGGRFQACLSYLMSSTCLGRATATRRTVASSPSSRHFASAFRPSSPAQLPLTRSLLSNKLTDRIAPLPCKRGCADVTFLSQMKMSHHGAAHRKEYEKFFSKNCKKTRPSRVSLGRTPSPSSCSSDPSNHQHQGKRRRDQKRCSSPQLPFVAADRTTFSCPSSCQRHANLCDRRKAWQKTSTAEAPAISVVRKAGHDERLPRRVLSDDNTI